jgi:hypothetical protein
MKTYELMKMVQQIHPSISLSLFRSLPPMKVIIVSKLGPSFSVTLYCLTQGVLLHTAQKQPASLNDSQSMTEIRVICTVA